MIQRIQSLYLLLAAICAIVLCFVAPVSFTTPEEAEVQKIYEVGAWDIHEMVYDVNDKLVPVEGGSAMSTWGLSVITLAIAVLALVDIFLFSKRMLQARLNIFTVVACVGYYALLFMYIWFAKARLGVDWYLGWSAGLPLVALVLVMMATRAILKDEAAIRAAWSGRLR